MFTDQNNIKSAPPTPNSNIDQIYASNRWVKPPLFTRSLACALITSARVVCLRMHKSRNTTRVRFSPYCSLLTLHVPSQTLDLLSRPVGDVTSLSCDVITTSSSSAYTLSSHQTLCSLHLLSTLQKCVQASHYTYCMCIPSWVFNPHWSWRTNSFLEQMYRLF